MRRSLILVCALCYLLQLVGCARSGMGTGSPTSSDGLCRAIDHYDLTQDDRQPPVFRQLLAELRKNRQHQAMIQSLSAVLPDTLEWVMVEYVHVGSGFTEGKLDALVDSSDFDPHIVALYHSTHAIGYVANIDSLSEPADNRNIKQMTTIDGSVHAHWQVFEHNSTSVAELSERQANYSRCEQRLQRLVESAQMVRAGEAAASADGASLVIIVTMKNGCVHSAGGVNVLGTPDLTSDPLSLRVIDIMHLWWAMRSGVRAQSVVD